MRRDDMRSRRSALLSHLYVQCLIFRPPVVLMGVIAAGVIAACGGTDGAFDLAAPEAGSAGQTSGANGSTPPDGSLDRRPDASIGGPIPAIHDAATIDSTIAWDAHRPDAPPPRDVGAPDVMLTTIGGPSRKRGLAFAPPQYPQDLAAVSAGISWWYNWSLIPNGLPTNGVEFVPMVWNGSYTANDLQTKVNVNAKYLLTFNEPNFGNQANLTPQQAAAAWPTLQAFAKGRGIPIVSPAVNYCGGNCNATDPFVWLSDFFNACNQCQVDFIAVHSYVCNAQYSLEPLLKRFESTFGKPLWLTEFSCLDGGLPATGPNEDTYMRFAIAMLESDPMVFRYAWFTSRDAGHPAINLLANPGQLTPLGQQYLSLPFSP
jgi:hypothetical protein